MVHGKEGGGMEDGARMDKADDEVRDLNDAQTRGKSDKLLGWLG